MRSMPNPDPPQRLLRGPMSRIRNVFILALIAGIIGALPAEKPQDAEPEPGIEIYLLHIDRYPNVIMEIAAINMVDPVDPEQFTITEDDEPIPSDRIQSIAPWVRRTITGIVLVIDASNSMAGSKLDEASVPLSPSSMKRPQDQVAAPSPLAHHLSTRWISHPTGTSSSPLSSRSKCSAGKPRSTTRSSRRQRCSPASLISMQTQSF